VTREPLAFLSGIFPKRRNVFVKPWRARIGVAGGSQRPDQSRSIRRCATSD